MRKSAGNSLLVEARPRSESVLNPLVALLAHPHDAEASELKEVFDDVACDWRLVRVADGAAGARQVMSKGLPDILIVCTDLPRVSGSDFVEWLRSFRCSFPVPILVCGEPADSEAREQYLRNDVELMLPTTSSRQILAGHLSRIITAVEKRRFSMMI